MMTTTETGYCALHSRRRTRVDLMDWSERPGQLRCLPRKECRPRIEGEAVVCRVHNKKRNVHQMREVAPGVFECKPEHMCRLIAMGVVPGGDVPPGALPGSRPYGAPTTAPSTSFAPSAQWAPVSVSLPSAMMQPQSYAIGASVSAGEALPHEVWCAKHGKKILRALCDFVDEACYVCRDGSTCRSTPLDSADHLRSRRCTELLCAKHNSLRLVSFLVLKDDGYECAANHQCRGVSAPSLGAGVGISSEQQNPLVESTGMSLAGQAGSGFVDSRQAIAPSSFFS